MTYSTNMPIREFQKTDIDAVQQLIYHTIHTSYTPVYPSQAIKFFKKFHSHGEIMKRYRKGKILVFEKDGNIIGTGSFVNGEILGVFINRSYQHQGYGKLIVIRLEKEAASNHYSKISLDISLPSKRFYENLGYTIIEECSLDIGNGECLNYWKAIKHLKK